MPDFETDSSFGNDVSPETLECLCYDDCSDCSRAPTPLYDGSRGWDDYGPEGTPLMERKPDRPARRPKEEQEENPLSPSAAYREGWERIWGGCKKPRARRGS